METNITLDQGLTYLCDERRIVAGASVAFGDTGSADMRIRGNAREARLVGGAYLPDVRALTTDSVFDLASVTKLFTCLAVLLLRQAGKLSLSETVGRFDKRFTHIAGVAVGDLLSFRADLRTERRIDEMETRAEAQRALFSILPAPRPLGRYYTDMGALVLKYVVEAAADMAFFDYLKENVLTPLGMRDTYAAVPEVVLPRTVCYNYERRYQNGVYTVDTACEPGVVNDKKARALSDGGRDLCGHAGLFSTLPDMIRLAQGLLSDALFPHEVLMETGTNRTGHRLPDGTYAQYLGYLCYTKHPDQTYSEVPACFGDKTVALNGYTGNHFSVDPVRNQFIIILADKTHNRVTVANGRPDPYDPTEEMLWNDGHVYPVSQNYTYLKDRYIKDPIGRVLEG